MALVRVKIVVFAPIPKVSDKTATMVNAGAFRMLRKAPAFTIVAVLSLTLGIGANTTIFTLTKAIFLQGVPIKDPGRVVSLYSNAQSRKGPPQEYLPTPYLNAVDYREKTNVFFGSAIAIGSGFNLIVSGKQVQVGAAMV